MLSHDDVSLWHSNYRLASNAVPKPELVAPSIWVAAPILPGTTTAGETITLFERRVEGGAGAEERISALKLITPHYQHVEGTSFAAPLVASTIACMLEASPELSPLLVRTILTETAHFVPGAERERQGAGAVAPGQAVARAMMERHGKNARWKVTPLVSSDGVVFSVHDHGASVVQVLGSWDGWSQPGLAVKQIETGFWQTLPAPLRAGRYEYKLLLNGNRWMDDPGNPRKAPDGLGGFNSVPLLGRLLGLSIGSNTLFADHRATARPRYRRIGGGLGTLIAIASNRLHSAVCQGGDLPQAQQSTVGGHERQAKHFCGSGQKAIRWIRMLKRQFLGCNDDFVCQRSLPHVHRCLCHPIPDRTVEVYPTLGM
jgi:hypothetical protein